MKPDDHRRKWDREEYEKLALERLREEISAEENDKLNLPVHRALLKRREYKVDLESKLGKSVVITKNTPASQSGGYVDKFCIFNSFY
jgi:U4/U6.U5 tri-snRNP component SNU23